jgi:hypothetical protein
VEIHGAVKGSIGLVEVYLVSIDWGCMPIVMFIAKGPKTESSGDTCLLSGAATERDAILSPRFSFVDMLAGCKLDCLVTR